MNDKTMEEKVKKLLKELRKAKIKVPPGKKKIVSLKGIFKGMRTTEEEIEKAKRSLFPPL